MFLNSWTTAGGAFRGAKQPEYDSRWEVCPIDLGRENTLRIKGGKSEKSTWVRKPIVEWRRFNGGPGPKTQRTRKDPE